MQSYGVFKTKRQAQKMQKKLKNDEYYPVQYVHIKKQPGRLKWMVCLGGKNSRYW